MRRWALRLGLVLAAGAAGFAVSAGAAQADSGLGGTLDHVAGTVSKVTGASHSAGAHSSHSGSRASTGSHASGSTHRAGSVRVTAHRAPVRAVTRPVLRTVQRVARPAVQPDHRATPARKTVDRAEQTRRATRTVIALQRSVLEVPAHAVRTPSVGLTADLIGLHVAVHVPEVAVDLGLPAVRVPAPGHPVLQLPPTSVEPPVAALVRHEPTTRTAVVPSRAGAQRHAPVPATTRTAVERPTPVVASPRTTQTAAVPSVVAHLGHAVAATSPGLPWSLPHDTTGETGPGLVGGSSAGAGPTGPLLLGLAVAAGLLALRTAHGRIPTGLAPQAFRLPRQPGFCPD